ncbi:unnamed protein product [Dicrocoelium dendriticum]|nr:unnamed protein product [Dicrocoelium dendriticum]
MLPINIDGTLPSASSWVLPIITALRPGKKSHFAVSTYLSATVLIDTTLSLVSKSSSKLFKDTEAQTCQYANESELNEEMQASSRREEIPGNVPLVVSTFSDGQSDEDVQHERRHLDSSASNGIKELRSADSGGLSAPTRDQCTYTQLSRQAAVVLVHQESSAHNVKDSEVTWRFVRQEQITYPSMKDSSTQTKRVKSKLSSEQAENFSKRLKRSQDTALINRTELMTKQRSREVSKTERQLTAIYRLDNVNSEDYQIAAMNAALSSCSTPDAIHNLRYFMLSNPQKSAKGDREGELAKMEICLHFDPNSYLKELEELVETNDDHTVDTAVQNRGKPQRKLAQQKNSLSLEERTSYRQEHSSMEPNDQVSKKSSVRTMDCATMTITVPTVTATTLTDAEKEEFSTTDANIQCGVFSELQQLVIHLGYPINKTSSVSSIKPIMKNNVQIEQDLSSDLVFRVYHEGAEYSSDPLKKQSEGHLKKTRFQPTSALIQAHPTSNTLDLEKQMRPG